MSCTVGTWTCWLYNWQTLIGGFLALVAGLSAGVAAIWVLKKQLGADQRRADAATASLKVAVGAEVRVAAAAALHAFNRVADVYLANIPYDNRRLALDVSFPNLLIIPSAGPAFGALGEIATQVAYIAGMIASIERAVERFGGPPLPGSEVGVPRSDVVRMLTNLGNVMSRCLEVLPCLSSAVADGEDARFKIAAREAMHRLSGSDEFLQLQSDDRRRFTWVIPSGAIGAGLAT